MRSGSFTCVPASAKLMPRRNRKDNRRRPRGYGGGTGHVHLEECLAGGVHRIRQLVVVHPVLGGNGDTHEEDRAPPIELRSFLWLLLIGTFLIAGVTRFMGPLGIIARPLLRLGTLQWPAAAAAALGVALALWARVTLGRNWSGSITLKQDHELVTAGPYAAIRH